MLHAVCSLLADFFWDIPGGIEEGSSTGRGAGSYGGVVGKGRRGKGEGTELMIVFFSLLFPSLLFFSIQVFGVSGKNPGFFFESPGVLEKRVGFCMYQGGIIADRGKDKKGGFLRTEFVEWGKGRRSGGGKKL